MPDNAGYYHAAYIVAAVLYGGYVMSLLLRARKYGASESSNRHAR